MKEIIKWDKWRLLLIAREQEY